MIKRNSISFLDKLRHTFARSTNLTGRMPTSPPSKKPKLEADFFQEDRNKANVSAAEFVFNKKRVKLLSGSEGFLRQECKALAYYMHRDQRVQDNWAMIYAQKVATEHGIPLHVIAMISSNHPKDAGATLRAMKFSLDGLQEVAMDLNLLNIAFHLIIAQDDKAPGSKVAEVMSKLNIGCLVTDFSPLRHHRGIIQQIVDSPIIKRCPIYQVDAHNIVPVTVTSEKQEYAARTIRNKITGKLEEFLTEFPPVIYHPYGDSNTAPRYFARNMTNSLKEDWKEALESLKMDKSVGPVSGFKPGTKAGINALKSFIQERIKIYDDKRNDPNANALSDLSPWFHFGQLSVQRAVLYVKKVSNRHSKSFIEEAVVRRELSDNFCYYNESYDKVVGAYEWAQTTLNDHAEDKRPYLYTREQLQRGLTHDRLWNAAQLQLRNEGKMHGFMRMYWAKKILEWTESPEVALADAIFLNDHYSLDGNDANGYVGCMWSICGIHDQGWRERPIFGKIRYMNYEGCKKKFDIEAYIKKYGSKGQ